MRPTIIAIIIALIATTTLSVRHTGVTGGGDFYVFETCPDFDSGKYVQNLDLDFSQIPTSGQPCTVTIKGNIVQNFYVTYVEMVAKFNGIKIITQKIPINEPYKQG